MHRRRHAAVGIVDRGLHLQRLKPSRSLGPLRWGDDKGLFKFIRFQFDGAPRK
jgi:hypothetical protein